MSRSFDSLIPIRRILKLVGATYSRMTFRPALVIEGDGVTVTDDPTYVDEFGNTVGKTVVSIAGAADLSPNGTLAIATTLTDTLNVGSATCAVNVECSTIDILGTTTFSLEAPNGASVMTFDSLTVSDTDGSVLSTDGAGNNAVSASGDLTLTGSPIYLTTATVTFPNTGCSVAPAIRTTNAAAAVYTDRGGSAWASATLTNLIGGKRRIAGGRGGVPGTDKGGDVEISVGRAVADNSTGVVRVTFGDATDDDFENPLVTIGRDTSARCLVTSTPTIVFSSGGQYVVSASTEVQIEAGGGSYGSLYLGSGLWQQYMPGGHEVVLGPSAANRGGRKCPARVTPGSAAATAIGTFTVPANSAGRFRGTLTARNGAGNAKSWDVSIEFDADGSNVTVQAAGRVFTVLPGNVGTITTVAGDLTTSVSGLVVTVTAANGSGYVFSLTGCLEV
jgi:hypothetical protein